jgi:hypothetical protein
MRFKKLTENSFEIPFSAGNTAKEIQTERAVLRKRVARKMRFREKAKASNPSCAGKLMPLRFADGTELHFPNDVVE